MRMPLASMLLLLAVCVSAGALTCRAEEAWRGVDEAVVEKFAEEHGRPATGCPLDIEGDALLFAFLAGGAIGGFVLGYFYREFSLPGGRGSGNNGDSKNEG